MKKLSILVSDINKALAFEWMAIHLRSSYRLTFVILGTTDTYLARFLTNSQIPHQEVIHSGVLSSVRSFFQILTFLRKEKPQIVHAHLWRATVLGIPAAWLLRIPKRVITRHHAMVHYREFLGGRKWDRLMQCLATDIIAVSENTRAILIDRDMANPDKVRLIHHGFDLPEFTKVNVARVELLRERYQTYACFPVVGVVARYLEWKGIDFIIQAFQQLLNDYPRAKLLVANATGSYGSQIQMLLHKLPEASYREIVFEQDMPALYKLMDVHVHVPIDAECEAFGQTYVEALAAGVPSVFTLSGVAREFIIHEQNALVVPFCDSLSIYQAIGRILEGQDLRENIIKNGRKSASLFSLDKMISQLQQLYGR